MKKDIHISVDIEADGKIPGDFSMISIGACVVGAQHIAFQAHLKPISARFDHEALAISGLDRNWLAENGEDPEEAMTRFAMWVEEVSNDNRRPVFVGFNAPFDWMFVCWYFIHFLDHNPFGISALDIKSYYMGASGVTSWEETRRTSLPLRYREGGETIHEALDDARKQATVIEKLFSERDERSVA